MFQYSAALKLLYKIENPSFCSPFSPSNLERELHRKVSSKFRVVVDMQRYGDFNAEELRDVEGLLREFPMLNVVWPEKVKMQDGSVKVFSNCFDGYCEIDERGRRVSKYRIELPGWPILGDGKGCNQVCRPFVLPHFRCALMFCLVG